MGEPQQTPKNGTQQKDVYQEINEMLISKLQQSIIPWRMSWANDSLPTNLLTRRPYRGINTILLASLGHEWNLFITEKLMKDLGGSVKGNEQPHTVVFWKYGDNSKLHEKAKLQTYGVYNVSQCIWETEQVVMLKARETTAIDACEKILATMPNRPEIRHKEQKAYYDPGEGLHQHAETKEPWHY